MFFSVSDEEIVENGYTCGDLFYPYQNLTAEVLTLTLTTLTLSLTLTLTLTPILTLHPSPSLSPFTLHPSPSPFTLTPHPHPKGVPEECPFEEVGITFGTINGDLEEGNALRYFADPALVVAVIEETHGYWETLVAGGYEKEAEPHGKWLPERPPADDSSENSLSAGAIVGIALAAACAVAVVAAAYTLARKREGSSKDKSATPYTLSREDSLALSAHTIE